MRIELTTKNYQASDKLKEILQKKIAKLDKYFDDDDKCRICLKKEKNVCKMELGIEYKGNFLRAEVLGENFYDTIDVLLPKIEKQIYKYRSKIEKKLRTGAFKGQNLFGIDESDFSYGKLVKVKKFDVKPISVEDAIGEMDLLGHSFYVFLEEKSNEIRVIYRRDDGEIGMIEPVI